MKQWIQKIKDRILSPQMELRERVFRVFILVGTILYFLTLLKSVFLMENQSFIPFFVMLPVLVVELLLTYKFRRINAAIDLAAVVFLFIAAPGLFFQGGGLAGSGPLWLALGIVLVFLCFSGKQLAMFLTLALAVDLGVYGIGYLHPELIIPLQSRWSAFFDSFFALVVVGVFVGVVMKIKLAMFKREHELAQQQHENLKKITESKNNFFASMSHEIRTPINTIIGLNEMILRESEEEETREYAANIQSAGRMLLNLVNDILDLSQMEMKRMEIVPDEYSTEELFTDLVDMIRIRLEEKNLEFAVDIDENIPTRLYGDVRRVKQVVLNLLTNAAKYTREGTVSLSARIEDGDRLRIIVRDTGIGIRKEDLEQLFDPFKRMDRGKNMTVEGSGLGLSITRQLVEMMGGEITVDSIYTKGSVFTVVLPQQVIDKTPIGRINFLAKTSRIEETYERSFEAPEARILIVDDNRVNAMVASKLLGDTRVQIDYADSGKTCLEMTVKKYYHVILMDYMMPEMDGVETLKQLRSQENGLCRDSAVVILSASAQGEAGKFFADNDFDGYLEKPIQGADLEREILRFIPEDIVEYRKETGEGESSPAYGDLAPDFHHKRKKICISTDCVSDLSDELLEKYDIGLMYLYIRTKNGRFMDTREIDSDNLVSYARENDNQAMTDDVSVEEYEAFFADMLTRGEQLIHISMAKNVGKSYEAAMKAAQSFDHVTVVDSGQISCGQGMVALYAAKLAQEENTREEICEKVERMKKRVESGFLLSSAAAFGQSGYMNKNLAGVMDALRLHPVVKMSQSGMVCRGVMAGDMENCRKRFISRQLWKKRWINTDVISVSYAGFEVSQQNFVRKEITRRIPFAKVYMEKASVSNACTLGAGSLGMAYYRNVREE